MLVRRLSLMLALAWMGLLFYLSHQPGIDSPLLFPGQDKVFHAGVYGILAILLLMSLPRGPLGYDRQQIGSSVLIASLYGISDEIHQYFVPGRNSDVMDWAADTAGALIAAALLAWLSRRWKSNRAIT
jgi:VanZ family protein